MAIDPMLYERISGRSADPSKKLGQALAQSSRREADNDPDDLGNQITSYYKAKWLLSVVGSLVVFGVVLLYVALR